MTKKGQDKHYDTGGKDEHTTEEHEEGGVTFPMLRDKKQNKPKKQKEKVKYKNVRPQRQMTEKQQDNYLWDEETEHKFHQDEEFSEDMNEREKVDELQKPVNEGAFTFEKLYETRKHIVVDLLLGVVAALCISPTNKLRMFGDISVSNVLPLCALYAENGTYQALTMDLVMIVLTYYSRQGSNGITSQKRKANNPLTDKWKNSKDQYVVMKMVQSVIAQLRANATALSIAFYIMTTIIFNFIPPDSNGLDMGLQQNLIFVLFIARMVVTHKFTVAVMDFFQHDKDGKFLSSCVAQSIGHTPAMLGNMYKARPNLIDFDDFF